MEPQLTRRPGEVVFAILMLVTSLFLFWHAYKISGFTSISSPGAFPIAATAIMVIASIATVVNTLRLPSGPSTFGDFRKTIVPNIVIIFSALILFYGMTLENAGFIITSFGFLFLSITLLYKKGMGNALLFSFISIIIVYVIFRLVFKVVLPEGIIPERRILADIGAMISNLWGAR